MTTSSLSEWLPDHCPSWCADEHAVVLAETGDWPTAQAHHRHAGEGVLSEIRNCHDGRVERPGGGSWNLAAEQTPMRGGGELTVETIRLEVHSKTHDHVTLPLTSGEARVLARQLEAIADRLDLP